MSDINLLLDNSSLDFTLFVDLLDLQQINLHRNDRDILLIVQLVNTAPQNVSEDTSFLNDDDDENAYEEDDESEEDYSDEETDEENHLDTEQDDDDDRSYHNSNSD